MGPVNRINTASVISLARKKCISQVLAGDVTLSNLFLDLTYIKKRMCDSCIMVKYMNLFCKEKDRLIAFMIKAKEYRLL